MSFTCPICWRTSYHPDDERYGYCGHCHDYTGAINGNQRYSSSSTPAGQEREMRMPTNDQEGKAQPEMPEVQGQRNSGSLRDVPRERMESENESRLRALQRTWIPLKTYAIWGITGAIMGISIASNVFVRWPKQGAMITTCIIFFAAGVQFAWLISEYFRFRRMKKELMAEREKFLIHIQELIAAMYPDDPVRAASVYMKIREQTDIS